MRGVAAIGAVAGLVTALALSGCGPVVACPAIGYLATLTVRVEGDLGRIGEVRLCIEEACTPGADPSSLPVPLSTVSLQAHDPGSAEWRFTMMPSSSGFTVRVLDTAGSTLVDTAADADWVRVGGTEQCGGPTEATVTVRI